MLFLCFSTPADLRRVFKMSAFGTYTCFYSWMSLVNECMYIVQCLPNVYLHKWKEWVGLTGQTKYDNNVKMTSVLIRKKNKQINKNSRNRCRMTWGILFLLIWLLQGCVVDILRFAIRKVVRQQMWGEAVVLIPAFSADPFWIYQWKKSKNWSTFVEVIIKIKWHVFSRHGVYYGSGTFRSSVF